MKLCASRVSETAVKTVVPAIMSSAGSSMSSGSDQFERRSTGNDSRQRCCTLAAALKHQMQHQVAKDVVSASRTRPLVPVSLLLNSVLPTAAQLRYSTTTCLIAYRIALHQLNDLSMNERTRIIRLSN